MKNDHPVLTSISIVNLHQLGTSIGAMSNAGFPAIRLGNYKPEFESYTKVKFNRGNIYYSHDKYGLFFSIYYEIPNSVDGFAGREIWLKVKKPSCVFKNIIANTPTKFKGCLWDDWMAVEKVSELLGIKIAQMSMMSGAYGFSAVYIDKEYVDKVLSLLKIDSVSTLAQGQLLKSQSDYFENNWMRKNEAIKR